jgi:hypothetical protein
MRESLQQATTSKRLLKLSPGQAGTGSCMQLGITVSLVYSTDCYHKFHNCYCGKRSRGTKPALRITQGPGVKHHYFQLGQYVRLELQRLLVLKSTLSSRLCSPPPAATDGQKSRLGHHSEL